VTVPAAWRARAVDVLVPAVAEVPVGRAPFSACAASWLEFFLMTGTAAVTLAGLIFVALSLHIDRLVLDSHRHLLALARATLMSFVMVPAVSLMMLTPGTSRRLTGFTLLAAPIVGIVVTARLVGGAARQEGGGFTRAELRRRVTLTFTGYRILAAAGAGVLAGIVEFMNWCIPAFCVQIGNAVGVSFELLVRVARDRRTGLDAPIP
jgi:hypothetical protein